MPLIYVPAVSRKRYNPYRRTRRTRRRYRKSYGSGGGAYTLDNGIWAGRGAEIGGAVASAFGAPRDIGSWLGRRLFHYPAKWFGSGAYKRLRGWRGRGKYRRGKTRTMKPSAPMFGNSGEEGCCISFDEYLGDILTSSSANSFKIENMPINPASPDTFPWLYNIALPCFQQYRFISLVFEFKSFSANALNSTNTALGAVFSSVQYDYTEPIPKTRYQVENTDWSQSSKPSESFFMPVECAPNQTFNRGLLMILNGLNIPPTANPKDYFLGRFLIGTTGFQGTSVNIGSLYVKYKVCLMKPRISLPLVQAHVLIMEMTGATTAAPYGPNAAARAIVCDTFGVSFNAGGTIMTLNHKKLVPGMRFIHMWRHIGTVAAVHSQQAWTGSANITTLTYFDNGTVADMFAPQDTLAGTLNCMKAVAFQVNSNDVDVEITLAGGTIPTGTVNSDMYIFQINGEQIADIGTNPGV